MTMTRTEDHHHHAEDMSEREEEALLAAQRRRKVRWAVGLAAAVIALIVLTMIYVHFFGLIDFDDSYLFRSH